MYYRRILSSLVLLFQLILFSFAQTQLNFEDFDDQDVFNNFSGNSGVWFHNGSSIHTLFGFGDAFSTDPHYYEVNPVTYGPILDSHNNLIIHPADWIDDAWENHVMLAVDQGPLLLSIINYLYQTAWDLSESSPVIQKGLNSIFVQGHNCQSTFPYPESFEADLGEWTQVLGDDLDWTLNSGPTTSSGTGPSAAAAGSYYVYMEASTPNFPNKIAILESPCINFSELSNPIFEFQYHMYGSEMGTLALEISSDNGGTWRQLWSENGDQGNTWRQKNINLSAYSGESSVRLRFYGQTGSSYTSDIAIDDVKLSDREQTPIADFSASTTTVSVGESIQFTDLSSNNPTSWSWIFEGGTPASSAAQNPQVIYNAAGVYNVTLTVSNADGSDPETKANYIIVSSGSACPNDQTIVTQEAELGSPGVGTTMHRSQASNKKTLWINSRGDVACWTVSIPANGNYSLIVRYSNDGPGTTDDVSVLVDGLKIGEFKAVNTRCNGCAPGTGWGVFTDSPEIPLGTLNSGNIDLCLRLDRHDGYGIEFDILTLLLPSSSVTTFPYKESFEADLGKWTQVLGDDLDWTLNSGPTTSSGTGPSAAAAGSYYVYMEASTPNFPNKIAILESPCINFSELSNPIFEFQYHMYGSEMGTLALEISSDNGGTWRQLWSENGDQGNTWRQKNINLSAYSGESSVRLRFYGQTGSSYTSDIAIDDVKLSDREQTPIADFSASMTTVSAGSSIQFTDLSSSNPTSWSWSFEGGSPASSTAQNPQVTYNAAGVYNVTLTVSNVDGNDTKTIVDYITVIALSPPTVDFTADKTNIKEGEVVRFTDLSGNNPTSWSWSFEGGTPASSAARNPQVTYNTAGVYNVTLTVSNADGSDTKTIIDYITVLALSPPTAGFIANKTNINEGEIVQFTDLSGNNPTSWFWTFGGGTPASSAARNPQVIYNAAGVYNVTLTVSNADGSDTKTKVNYIKVSSVSPCPNDQMIVKQEAELGSPGVGATMHRSQASNKKTLWVNSQGDVACWTVCIPANGNYSLIVRYSNDGSGTTDDVSVLVNGLKTGGFKAVNTRCNGCAPGTGWNVFTNSPEISLGTLNSGDIDLCLRLDRHDGYGIEFDKLTLTLTSNSITSSLYQESFGSGSGGWTQTSGDDLERTLHSGSAISSGTGPGIAPAIKVYPNPATKVVNIEICSLDGRVPGKINLLDIQGIKIKSLILDQNFSNCQSYQMGVESLPPGVYILQFLDSGNIVSRKISIIGNE